ncbi:hypothetical protein NMU03_10230 [Allocoprobacillus halotolerans]|uniref:Uncharacterized protein n=1 Tax=Allocoprobacillus halotolerans TaxID=2944914 RepID=A0ABY5I252_9FIRM|nr:hypothetical protein [Allocoprobacillus halotolerans]UTY38070.1 hypothetical protein NMU03_10230 [Allocoprobacillus halotolerans]
MLCYYVEFPTKHLTQDILIHMLLDWLEHSKNKMEGLSYDGRIPFQYQLDQKLLNIEIFEQQYLTLFFSTKDNHKNTHFIVEVIYDFVNEKIHLRFFKETFNESRYISAVSIPSLFKTIITSPYIQSDVYPFQAKAHRLKDIDIIKEIKTQTPLIYMRTKFIDANQLAREVLGLAHVCYCPRQKEEGCIEIIDEHGSRFYPLNKKIAYIHQIHEINELLRNAMIERYKDTMPSYETLYQNWVYHQQNSAIKNSQEYQEEFKEEIKRRQQEILELKEIYNMLLQDIEELKVKNSKLSQIHYHQESSLLCIDDIDKVSKYQKSLLQYIQNKAHNLETTHEIYRRLDILHALIKKNGGKL